MGAAADCHEGQELAEEAVRTGRAQHRELAEESQDSDIIIIAVHVTE